MNTQFGRDRFWTSFVEDHKDGFAGVRLHREVDGQPSLAAEVLFWDAMGQFFVQTFDRDVPVSILESAIAEAKTRVLLK